jgi:hypothetical protein
MSADREDVVFERERPRSSILEILDRQKPAEPPASVREADEALPAADDLTPLPGVGDAYSEAYSRPANKPLATLRLLMADGGVRGFSYGNYDSIDLVEDDAAKGPAIIVRFAGMAAIEVRIEGRKLLTLYDHLADQRVRWVRALPKGKIHKEGGGTVVTGISIRRVEGWPD